MPSALPFRSFRIALVIGVALSLSGCPFDKPEDRMARGKQLAAKQDHAGAIIEFKNFLQDRPKSAEARYLLGRELLAQDNPRAAEIELQKAYTAKYNRDLVVPLLVRSEVLQGQPERIASEFSTMELGSPAANAELASLLGAGALMQDKPDLALNYFRNAEQFLPDYPAARLGEARIKALRNDFDGASADIAELLAKDPKQFDVLLLKGDIARARGLVDEMIDAYRAASLENPSNVAARINLTSAYLARDAYDPAQQQLTELKKLAPKDPAVNYLDALLGYDRKDYLRANDAITLSLELNPQSGPAQLLSGAISLAIKQPAQAELHLLEGLRLSPNSIFGRRVLASLYLSAHQPQKASEVLQYALQVSPDDAVLLKLAGEAAVQNGDYAKASTLFARSTQIDPTNTGVRVRAAMVELAKGDEAAGFAALEAAAKSNVDDPAPDLALVIANLNRKQYDQALAAWMKLEKQQPNNPVIYNLRAAIDLGRDDKASARKALEHAVQLQYDFFPAVTNLATLDEFEGDVDAARDVYKTVLKKDPKNMLVLTALAQFEARHGAKADVVLPLLVEARRSNPSAGQPVSLLVSYYISQNNFKEALSTAQGALSRAPDNELYLKLVAGLQLQAQGADQAIAAYRRLIAMKPGTIEYQIGLGQAMILANQADLAVPVFEHAVTAQPNDTVAQTLSVDALLNANKTEEAKRLLATIRKTNPKSVALPELDGDVKMTAKQYADAATIYRRGLAQTPSSGLTIKLTQALVLSGNNAAANSVLSDWIKGHANDMNVRIMEADLALQSKEYGRAIEGYQAALKISPDNPVVMNNLAWALWQQKDPTALGDRAEGK